MEIGAAMILFKVTVQNDKGQRACDLSRSERLQAQNQG